jgi:RpiR family transcriptional regulator, carbohydrate utilization regulator
MKINLLSELNDQFTNLPNSFQSVAKVILTNPSAVKNMSIATLADEAGVSQPTVIRLCNHLGYVGFTEFKFSLAETLTLNPNYVFKGIKADDKAQSYIKSIGYATIASLNKVINEVDSNIIEAAVTTIANSRQINFWGQGASATVAQDAYHKFFRVGISCNSSSDPHMQVMLASIMKKDDVVMAISHTGRSMDLVNNVLKAKENGAITIGITKAGSALAKACNIVINVDIEEDTEIYTPMLSRLAHLMIIDILTIGVMLNKGESSTENLKKMKDALSQMKASSNKEEDK